ncbi:hypothetical protein [Aciditerrimonas ferrireducens]|uniref:hypothetical protein n=1 Tax=Aciditerrimonas ferrireducens TaxID=667306 RepID=UPI002004CC5D|nr:hypothetical protein [Aciditerrimonas ferrireducens]MCK4178041.1 hypothetical protein [Aciditerrimonas ferrireducens]
MAITPRGGSVSPAPGQTVAFSDAAWVRHELEQPWLTPAERAYLEALPVAASAPSPAALAAEAPPSLAAVPAGDPVMSGGCNFEDVFGATIAWFHAYLGFSDNGTKITQVSTPNNDVWESALSLNSVTYEGSSFSTSQPATGVEQATALDTGRFIQSFGVPFTTIELDANIHFDMDGSGAWSSHPVCTSSTGL